MKATKKPMDASQWEFETNIVYQRLIVSVVFCCCNFEIDWILKLNITVFKKFAVWLSFLFIEFGEMIFPAAWGL